MSQQLRVLPAPRPLTERRAADVSPTSVADFLGVVQIATSHLPLTD